MHELIRDITLCSLFAWMLGLLAPFSRQPLIPAYLIVGSCIGPFGAGRVTSQESISVVSAFGMTIPCRT
jgi:Kef-type K+ transport system membrane component KefB